MRGGGRKGQTLPLGQSYTPRNGGTEAMMLARGSSHLHDVMHMFMRTATCVIYHLELMHVFYATKTLTVVVSCPRVQARAT
jgi:hypothetical protein